MARIRLVVLLITIIVVGAFGTTAVFYARGYRLNQEDLSVSQRGLLVANSDPNGAQVFVDGELETATNNTITLIPGTHEVLIKKEGFLPWQKTIQIEKEEVTQVNAFLLPAAPSLSALTLSGAINPVISTDQTKVAYFVPEDEGSGTATPSAIPIEEEVKTGIWVLEMSNLPLGFNRGPSQITDASELAEADWVWSPDERELMVFTDTETYILDAGTFTPKEALTNVKFQEDLIRQRWAIEAGEITESLLASLPAELGELFLTSTENIRFAPDENRILYTASASATITEGIISPLPGSSTQIEQRELVPGSQYVYDIKEDKNFKVGGDADLLSWVPNSLNLISPGEASISVLDYDGTNKQTIFTGSFVFPSVFPSGSSGRIIILTNLGATGSPNNLYWLGLK